MEEGQYLLSALVQMGPVASNGMDLTPQPWIEIRSFCGGHFEEWEVIALREMSLAYLAGLKTDNPLAIAPVDRVQS